MRRLVPDYILSRYAAGRLGDTVRAAVLFVDVVGFSMITGRLAEHGQQGAEVVASLMRGAFEPLIAEAHGHGGFVVGFAGDAMTVVIPVGEVDDPAIHAAAAASAMQQASQLSEATPFGEFQIEVRLGGAIGDVTWGIVEDPQSRRSAYFVQGEPIDDAAAAQGHAIPGQSVLTGEMAAELGDRVATERLVAELERTGESLHRLAAVPVVLDHVVVPPTPPAAAAMLDRFFPSAVLEHPETGEFRQVVSAFIGVPIARSGVQLEALLHTVFALQRRYGGLFSRVDFGDKGAVLVLFWGAPVAHENDVMRALDFVVDMREETEVPITAGVTYGTAHAGFIGSEQRDEYTCYGPSTNLAARIMVEAPRGDIRVSADVARRASVAFDIDSIGEVEFKGFADPQPVFALVERAIDPGPAYSGPMVGRREELEALLAFIDPIKHDGFAGVALVRGEAGIGKSRLAHAVMAAVEAEGECSVYIGQTDETVRDSLNPFRYWLRRYFDQGEHQSEGRNKRAFAAALDTLIAGTDDQALASELDRTRSFLGALVDLSWSDSLYDELTGERRLENTVIALTSLFIAEGRRRPLLLVLEDVHWLDEDSRSFVPGLVRALALASAPVAIVATARPEEDDLLGGTIPSQVVQLGELSSSEVSELAAAELGGAPAPRLVTLLTDRADGNPFFVEELLRYLRDHDEIRRAGDTWDLVSPGEEPPLPSDVRAALVARLDRLNRSVHDVVQAAAVLGREFDVAVVELMVASGSFDLALKMAEEAGIWIRLADGRYMFRHALLRDAAYDMQSMSRRRHFHYRALAALQQLRADDAPMPYADLGFHAEHAGLTTEATRYLKLAGEAAAARYSNEQAAAHFSRALDLTPDDDVEARFTILRGREAAYHDLGRRDAQTADLQSLEALAPTVADPAAVASVALLRAEYAHSIGENATAIAEASRAIEMADAVGARELLASAHVALGRYMWRLRRHDEVVEHLDIAREIAVAEDLPAIEADVEVTMGIVASERDRYDEARGHFERGLRRARAGRDRRTEAWALNTIGMLSLATDDLAGAREALEEALAIRREIGYRVGEAAGLTNRAILNEVEGRYDDALADHERALSITRAIDDRYNEGWSLNNLGLLQATVGQYVIAESTLGVAMDIALDDGDPILEANVLTNLSLMGSQMGRDDHALAWAMLAERIAVTAEARELEAEAVTNRGHALLGLGDLEGAEASYAEGVAIRKEIGHGTKAFESMAGIGRVRLQRGDPKGAREAIGELLDVIHDPSAITGTYDPFRVYLTCIDVLAATGEVEAADTLLTMAQTLLDERASHIGDEEMRRSYLENVAAHRELLAR